MKKALSSVLVVLLGASLTAPALASSCNTLICMAGKVQGQLGGDDCNQPIKDFFSIKKYHHGHFDLGPTSDARREFFNQCPGSQQNASNIDGIIS